MGRIMAALLQIAIEEALEDLREDLLLEVSTEKERKEVRKFFSNEHLIRISEDCIMKLREADVMKQLQI